MAVSDAERDYYRSVLSTIQAGVDKLSVQDLRYAYFLAALNGDLPSGASLPPGGPFGYVLTKLSATDGDVGWVPPSGGGVLDTGWQELSGSVTAGAWFKVRRVGSTVFSSFSTPAGESWADIPVPSGFTPSIPGSLPYGYEGQTLYPIFYRDNAQPFGRVGYRQGTEKFGVDIADAGRALQGIGSWLTDDSFPS